VTGCTQKGASIEVLRLIKLTDWDQKILMNCPPENLEFEILNPGRQRRGSYETSLWAAFQKRLDLFFQIPDQLLVFLQALMRQISVFPLPEANGLTAFPVVFAKGFKGFALFKKGTDDLFLIWKALIQGENACLDDRHGKMPQVVWV
jgi:hypothetical protein